MSKIRGTLVAGVKYNTKKELWQGVVVEHVDKEVTVLSVGEETTEGEILRWAGDTVQLMRNANRTDVQAPDMHDRLATAREV